MPQLEPISISTDNLPHPTPLEPNIYPPTPVNGLGIDELFPDESARAPDEYRPPPEYRFPPRETHLLDAHNALEPRRTPAPTADPEPRRGSVVGASSPGGPFNFQSMTASKSPIIPKPNQRRGHRYKHSSVSHQIFLEPPIRAPLSLPASLPMPTWTELLRSVTLNQRTRALWCVCHLLAAGFAFYSAGGSMALTALSHLIVFDALGASLCVAVDVLSNFEVWRRSSIRHPFGLERAEVLAGFAMSVFLLFMGFDIVSHAAEHLLEGLWGEEGGNVHEDHVARVSAGSVDSAALVALVATTVSAVLLKNHERISRAMRFASLDHLPSILSNPSHLLTLACSTLLLLIPLLDLPQSSLLDRGIAITIAVSMIAIGVRLVRALGSMLLMSYGGKGVGGVLDEIASDPSVREVQEARFWQAHHGLCIATVKVVVLKGIEEGKLREKVGRLVRERLGSGNGGVRWEVSVAVSTEF